VSFTERAADGPWPFGKVLPAGHKAGEDMTARVVTVIGGTMAIGSAFLSGVTIWLILSQPVRLAQATGGGDVTALFRAVTGAVYEVVVQVLKYL
jgi:hypothetical protein